MELQVRTRGNSSPQGKIQIFFSCHPADFNQWFNVICEDVFKSQNCAIYYKSIIGEDLCERDLNSLLSEMKLFLVPITTNFLFEESISRNYEYGFALKMHIPVIPIIVEPGADLHFKEQLNNFSYGYGELHFLNRISNDLTEIPYEEKLANRLSNILGSEIVLERVRSAFSAHIFLSYRKKDREIAQHLMRLIHEIPFCQDIAIWYDEYLIPGEQWSRAISNAIEQSACAVLVVTPHLTEKGNYIHTIEYPDILKKCKPIIPIEMSPTDITVLHSMFPKLPYMIDGNKIEVIEQALETILKKRDNRKDLSAEREYLIGLAYLNGIDVERNVDRALKVITLAAQKGYIEAMAQLAVMYEEGVGVKQNYETMLKWMIKCHDTVEQTYLRSSCIENGIRLLKVQKILISKSRGLLNDWVRTELWMNRALKLTEKLLQNEKMSEELCYEIALLYMEFGNIEFLKGEIANAIDWFQNGLKILENDFLDIQGSTKLRVVRLDLISRLGAVFIQEGNLDRGEYLEKQFLNESFKLLKVSNSQYDYRRVIEGCKEIGLIESKKNNPRDAVYWFNCCLFYNKQIIDEFQQSNDKLERLDILLLAIDELIDERTLLQAKRYCKKVYDEISNLHNENAGLKQCGVVAKFYHRMARVDCLSGDFEISKKNYIISLNTYRELESKTELLEYQRNVMCLLIELGDVNRDQTDFDQAQRYYENALNKLVSIRSKSDSCIVNQDLCLIYSRLGDLYNMQGRLHDCEKKYREGLASLNIDSEQEFCTMENINLVIKLSNVLILLNKNQEARMICEKVIRVLNRNSIHSLFWDHMRSKCCMIMGNAFENESDLVSAESWYKKGLRYYDQIKAEEKDDIHLVLNRIAILQKLLHIAKLQRNKGKQKELKKSIRISKKYLKNYIEDADISVKNLLLQCKKHTYHI